MKPEHRNLLDRLVVAPQYILPAHLLSQGMHYLARIPLGKVTTWLIQQFVRWYKVDLTAAVESDPVAYATFNDFFTRALKPEARPIAASGIACPVDGSISQLGTIEAGRIIQAKGHDYTLLELVGGIESLSRYFEKGIFCTLYLSPRDYHRIHIPVAGRPMVMAHVPGRLFSVNQRTADTVPGLFARNERVITLFKSEAGPLGMVMVGAIFVGSVETAWQGQVMPMSGSKKPQRWQVPDTTKLFQRGEEIARFNMGSTVILLFDANRVAWLPELVPGMKVRMGQAIGKLLGKAADTQDSIT